MPCTTRRPAATLVLIAGLAGLAGLTGCRGGRGGVTASGTAAPDVLPTTTTVAEISSSTSRRPSTTVRSTSTSKANRSPTTTAAGGRPQVVVPQQGDRVFAVFVATGGSLEEPAFAQAIARLKSLGYPAYAGGDTGCSRGAKEALPQLGQYSLSVEFATRAEADRFIALYGTVIGVAAVTVYCAD